MPERFGAENLGAERSDANRFDAGKADSRARLLATLRHPSRGQAVGGVLLGLLGFAMVTQVQSNERDDTYAGLRTSDLVQVLNGLNAQSRRADSEIAGLERTRRQLTDQTQARQAAVDRAKDQAQTLGILAGTLPAEGPGIRITVNDPEGKVSLNNLLDAVEELRAAGAEAMEFDDSVRVIAQTSFEQDDSGLLVDGHQVDPPYVIDVIGDPSTLSSALNFPLGFSYDVKANDGSVKVDKPTTVKVSSTVPATAPTDATSGQ
ncbi:DUF881 domain-containing protein [Nocardioides mangrovicus]|uniref:DUF881 domain-containing protein n=1 Tax=Nocardioides mangrovicus TaxID=2478913 RepID=A0A3L8P0V7_9ACTN|nr:DUF881 domain-containing protein [Nocardioides mangrovicus]RLV48651.1 DUF881 domain-containing protein [Nocardioides mangrovicus]